jgi:hypothetical protein
MKREMNIYKCYTFCFIIKVTLGRNKYVIIYCLFNDDIRIRNESLCRIMFSE